MGNEILGCLSNSLQSRPRSSGGLFRLALGVPLIAATVLLGCGPKGFLEAAPPVGTNDGGTTVGCSGALQLRFSFYAVGNRPFSVAAGDFNGDRKLDLVVANDFENTVSVLLGNGDGSFQMARNSPVGSSPIPNRWPVSIAAGDFDGDGKLDVVVADSAFNSVTHRYTGVSVLLGNGDGTFRPVADYPAGDRPTFVMTGDFNADGILDLAVSNAQSHNVSVLIGNGNGAFRHAVNYDVGADAYAVAAGDFNQDGKVDLAVATSNGRVAVLLGNGNGIFQAPNVYGGAGMGIGSVATGDFNRDGKLDLALTSLGSSSVSILLGNGDGTFQTPLNFAAGGEPESIITGDFDGDGKLDLAVANFARNMSVLLGNGDGTFQPAVPYGGAGGRSLAMGDFDGDGNLDLAQTDVVGARNNVAVFLNQGCGTRR